MKGLLMSDYKLKNIQEGDETLLRFGVFLVIIDPQEIPPHLSLMIHGKLFSLDTKGPSIYRDLSILLRRAFQYQKQLLFVELKMKDIIVYEDLQQQIAAIITAYGKAEAGKITCLAPLKDFCAEIYGISLQQINFIFELLPQLEQNDLLSNIYHINMQRELKAVQDFKLATYSMFEINERIHQLSN